MPARIDAQPVSDVYESLFGHIESTASMRLSEEEKIYIRSRVVPKRLRRKKPILLEGDICRYLAFIVKGAGRIFSVDTRGLEHTLQICLDGAWLGAYESYHLQQPSRYQIETLEDAELLLVSSAGMQELRARIPALHEAMRRTEEADMISYINRLHAVISLPAQERYEEFMRTCPLFDQRFPQTLIASYLGVSAETLSRIRKQSLHRSAPHPSWNC